MLPIVSVPATIATGMQNYRDVFCREAGFVHVSRYVSGLILSPKKTLQGMYAQQVWPEGEEGIFSIRWGVARMCSKRHQG
jgi:hypothetical protein